MLRIEATITHSVVNIWKGFVNYFVLFDRYSSMLANGIRY